MRALVTGHEGFLGRHFTEELGRRGYDVWGVDTASVDPVDCRRWFTVWPDRKFDLVVHCAAVIGGRAVIDGSPLETAVNLELDAAMFRWAAKAKPGRVLYISSSAAYPVVYQGAAARQLSERYVTWERLKKPDQVYGWTKVVGEMLAGRLREEGVPVTVVRPFSGYGGDQSPDYPFRAFLDRVRGQENPFDIWSNTVRDFIHVSDVVAGALAVAESGTEDPVNLCTGIGTWFSDLAVSFCDAAGLATEIRILTDKPTGVAYRVGDPTRVLQYYTPKVDLLSGIRMALEGTG